MQVGVELLASRVKLLDTMSSKRLEQLRLGHLHSVEKVEELGLVLRDGLSGVLEGESEDVDGTEEVGSELLDGKRLGLGLLLS